MSKQLTLMPMLDGHATISKDALTDPVLLYVLTDICLDTMADNHIFPEIWELHIKVTVDQ